MKIARFTHDGTVYSGAVEGEKIRVFQGVCEGRVFSLEDVSLLPPVVPQKIVCVGLNYSDHAAEMGLSAPQEPVIFIKPASTLLGPGGTILYPSVSERVDYEAELAVVIGSPAHNVEARSARDYIMGFTCLNDVTARDLQKRDVQWTRSKSFDTFAPIGPWIETELDPDDLFVKAYLNGELKQSSRTGKLIFGVNELVSFISGIMTLLPGDVISTGTPGGIGPMMPGDEVTVEIEGIGKLTNRVEKE